MAQRRGWPGRARLCSPSIPPARASTGALSLAVRQTAAQQPAQPLPLQQPPYTQEPRAATHIQRNVADALNMVGQIDVAAVALRLRAGRRSRCGARRRLSVGLEDLRATGRRRGQRGAYKRSTAHTHVVSTVTGSATGAATLAAAAAMAAAAAAAPDDGDAVAAAIRGECAAATEQRRDYGSRAASACSAQMRGGASSGVREQCRAAEQSDAARQRAASKRQAGDGAASLR